jgi:hypothetical protein
MAIDTSVGDPGGEARDEVPVNQVNRQREPPVLTSTWRNVKFLANFLDITHAVGSAVPPSHNDQAYCYGPIFGCLTVGYSAF